MDRKTEKKERTKERKRERKKVERKQLRTRKTEKEVSGWSKSTVALFEPF